MVKKFKKRIKFFPMDPLIIRMGPEVQDILDNSSLKIIDRTKR